MEKTCSRQWQTRFVSLDDIYEVVLLQSHLIAYWTSYFEETVVSTSISGPFYYFLLVSSGSLA